MMVWRVIACVVLGYLFGGWNGAIIISRRKMHEDVRSKGSGNAGMTNFLRSYGGWATLLVVAVDAFKTVAACADKGLAERVQSAFMCQRLRVYTCPDIVGVELGAAHKNVIALCAGVCDGMGYGDNTKALLMTRGLAELARLGMALGAKRETFAGLAGVGDLIVTCTSMHSRNRRAGILIGQGVGVQEAMQQVGAVVEGYYAARAAWELAKKHGVEMPITEAAHAVLYDGRDPRTTIDALMLRQKTCEVEGAAWAR